MKHFLPFILIALLSVPAHAQVEFYKNHLIADGWIDFEKERRSLTATEKKQRKLLVCIQELLEDAYGGIYSPKIAARILAPLFDGTQLTETETTLIEATRKCRIMMTYVKPTKNPDLYAIEKMIKKMPAPQPVKDLITRFSLPTKACINRSLSVQAGIVVTGRLGGSYVHCVFSNGYVRNYFGPIVALSGGSALMIIQSNKVIADDPTPNDSHFPDHEFGAGRIVGFGITSENNYALVFGTDKDKDNFTLGFGSTKILIKAFEGNANNFHLGIRVLNGKRRWDLIFDSLK